MIILGIETSCDETAAAVVKKNGDKIEVLSSIVASSEELHQKTGGIIPEQAAREQVKSIIPVIEESLKTAKYKSKNIDAIAVTYGPGLIGSLLVGVETAKTLSKVWNKPIIPINHLTAHLASCFIDSKPDFPAIGLVVSGGHTDFVLLKNINKVEYVGGTRDDAAGEAFDKSARLIGLDYPGGPAISKLADIYIDSRLHGNDKLDLFPRPMINSGDLDMSFSGLKTAVLNYVKANPSFDKNKMSAEIQEAIVDTLITKAKLAIDKHSPKSFLLAGGVSANSRLRVKMSRIFGEAETPKMYVPIAKYSTDNAVMIAVAALMQENIVTWKEVNANPSLSIEE